MRFQKFTTASVIAVLTIAGLSCIQKRQPTPPVAKVEPKLDSLHGVVRVDDYYWLRQRGNPAVLEYLEAENAYTDAMMEDTKGLQEVLYQELVGRLKETDMEVAEKDGDYYYYTRTEQGKQYEIICRKKGSLDAAEQVLLDENLLAEGHDYLDVGAYRVSPDDHLLAYTVDTNGSEKYTIYIRDLKTGELLSDRVPNVYYSLEWGNDNKTIFYTVLDEAMRPYKLFRHSLGEDYTGDEMIYHETDQAYEMYLSKTKSKRYLLLELESNTTSEIHYLDANRPAGDFRAIHPRQHKMEYSVYHHGDRFYILTNDEAPNFKLMVSPVRRPDKRHWTEYIPHSDSVKIDGVEIFKDFMAVYVRRDGLKQIRVFDLKSGESHYLEFPEEVYTYRAGKNKDFDSRTLRFTYSSPITPNTVYDYDMKDRAWRSGKSRRSWGDMTSRSTLPTGFWLRPPMERKYRFRSITKKTWRGMVATLFFFTDTALTDTARNRVFRAIRSVCSNGALWSLALMCAVEGRWGVTGMNRECCFTSVILSPISLPAPNM